MRKRMTRMKMQPPKVLLVSVCALALCACALTTPTPKLASTDVPAAFEQMSQPDAPIWPAPDWWQGFSSTELDGLIQTAQAGNLNLAAAEARVLQADARARQAGASLLPAVNLSAGGQREINGRRSADILLGASYELDFWGKNRNLLSAAQATSKATQADRETVALTAITSTANTYFQLLSLRERLSIARLNLENSLAVLTVTEARVRDGVATQLELAQQRATVAGQQAAIPQLEQQELQARATLALLLGRPPEGFNVSAQNLNAIASPSVAPGLPAQLLVRRPDVVTAEANLQSANANVAVARAAFFPSISLTVSGGISSGSLTDLVINPIATLGVGLSLAQTIFDAGRREAQTDEARARENELLAAYRGAAITAFSEVETSLGAIMNLTAQQEFQTEQVSQAEQAFNIAQVRYREGVDDFLHVLDAQRQLYSARDLLGLTRLQRLQAIVALYKALGGGWQDPASTVAQK